MPIPPPLPPPLALPLISPPSHQLVASGARTTTTVVSAQAVNASKLLRILEHHPNGMRQRDIHIAMNISAASLLPLLQALLNSKRVEVYQMQRPLPAVAAIDAQRAQTLANSDPSNKSLAIAAKEAHEAARNATLPPEIFYKSVSAEKAQQLADLTPDDQVVLQIIERHGNAGVWVRAIKQTSRFNQPQVTKIIKRLEGRKLIKAVKSVVYKWRKMYMLYDLEPAKQVTGGPWYTDQTLDVEYIAGLRKVVLEILEKMNGIPVTAIDVSDYIEKGKISTIALSPRDIVVILDSLVYDGLCDYADGSLVRQQSLRLASMAMFPGSGTALQVGRNEATLASCIAEPKTHEEIERELTKREEVNDGSNDVDNTGAEEGIVERRMGVARALLVQSQEAKSRGRVILLKRGGAPESMIGLGGGFVRRAQLSSMLSASLTLEDKITKDDTEDEGDILNEGKRKGRRGNDEIGLHQSPSKLNATAITSKAHLKRKRRIEDSSEEEEEGKVDEDVDANDSEDSEELKMDEGGGADVEVGEEERGGDGGNAESNSDGDGDGDGVAEIKEGKDSSSRSKRPSTKIVYEDNDESDANDDNKEVVNDDEVDEEGKESERGDGKKRSNRIKNNESRIGLPSTSVPSKRTEDEQVSRRGYVLVKGGRGGSVDHITSTPCGVCPVAAKCEPGGLISPTSCIYISQWMEF
jgi:hypothetical protein